MASKAQQQAFNKKVEKYLISMGAVKTKEPFPTKNFTYEIETVVGLMSITCHEPYTDSLYSIYVRLYEPQRVAKILPTLYPVIGHTGKWNINEYDSESALNSLEYRIEKTIEFVLVD